ncbi:MAG TPA: LapA family protein [Dongiaceae bacterium]|nr:LapA family protein [Dongiaceae bacterium]
MRYLVFWIITLPLFIILVDFTVMNTQAIALNFWPLPWEMPLPAYALVFGALLVGFLFGVLVMWRHGAPARRRHRDLHRQYNVQAGELETLRRQAPVPSVGGAGKGLVKADANVLVPPAI